MKSLMMLGLLTVSLNTGCRNEKEDANVRAEPEGANPGECIDGADNDYDGDYDCNDADCAGSPDCFESDCTDGADNDRDGDYDCDDSDCADDEACQPVEDTAIEDTGEVNIYEGDEPGECSDGIDNDGDGDVDCADEDCSGSPDCEVDDCWSLSFDGVDDYVEVGVLPMLNDFTFETWIKASNITHLSRVIDYDGGSMKSVASLDFAADGTIRGRIRQRNDSSGYGYHVYSNNSFDDNNWHHVAFTRQQTSLQIFVDGVLSGQASAPIFPIYPDATLALGWGLFGEESATNTELLGTINSVRISNIARYSSQFSPTSLFVDSNTLAVWEINENGGNVIFDSSTAGLDGTIIGATWVNDCP